MALIQGIVDTQKQNLKSLGIVNSGDDLTIELEVKQNGVNIEFVNPIFELLATKSDGTRVRQLVDITYIGNVVNIIGDEQLVTSPGIVTLQLIIKDNKRSSTCLFYFMCGTSLDRDIIQSISKVEVLNQLDEYVVQAFANLKEYEQRIIASDASIRNLNEDMIKAEKVRVQAEINRGNTFDNLVLKMNNAINAAIATDETLQNNEIKRIDNYNTLKAELESIKDDLILLNNNISKEEEKRVQAEIDRVNKALEIIEKLKSTNDKVTIAEAERVTEFNNIKSELTSLKEALTTINNIANSNEEIRKTNESGRVAAEQQRVTDFEKIKSDNTSLGVALTKKVDDKIVEIEANNNTFKQGINEQYDNIVTENNNFKNQMNTDFGEAKIGYDGTTHNNIVERLNYDFDRIEQKHNESSYLEYSGTSVKADNSYYGLSKDLCIKGRTIQNLMNESVMGISKFTKYSNTTIEDNSDYLTINRGTTELKVSTVLDGTLLKPNTTYTIILTKKDINTYIQVYDSDSATFLLKPINSDKVTFTTKNKTNLLYFYFLNINSENVQSIKAYKRATIILEGDYSNTSISEIPYSEGIYSVGEKENNLITSKSCGKNLFNIEKSNKPNEGIVISKDLNHILCQGWAGGITQNDSIKSMLKPNTKYTISFLCEMIEKIGNVKLRENKVGLLFYNPINGYSFGNVTTNLIINKNDNEFLTGTFTTPLNMDGYKIIGYTNMYSENGTIQYDIVKFSNIQIEENPISSSFLPYQENKQQLQLTEPLRSLPNRVNDELFGNELIRRVGKLVLDGVNNQVSIYKEYTTHIVYHNTKKLENFKPWTYTNSLICDKFAVSENHASDNSEGISQLTGYFYIRISKNRNIGGNINEWVKNNPITIYYELAEPIITKLDKTIQLKILNETTHITSDNYLQPNLSVKVPTNVPKVIQNLKIENRSLESELNKANNLILENAEYNLDNDLRITKYELGL